MTTDQIQRLSLELLEYDSDMSPVIESGETTQRRPLFSLDPLPAVISQEEFSHLERRIGEWASALERAYHDVYSEQEILRATSLTPEVLWNPEAFVADFHRLIGTSYRPLTLLRFDIVKRGGEFTLVAVKSGSPAMIGRAIENRINQSRVSGALLPRRNVERIAPFFANMKELWRGMSPRRIEEPTIVLWSGGSTDGEYRDHSYLARYFGYPLVESRDLTVRSGRLYLKLLEGLRQVDVVVRLAADTVLDPLSRVSRDALGVAGLVQAVREGGVVVANAPGSDILGDPRVLTAIGEWESARIGRPLELPLAPTDGAGEADPVPFWIDGAWKDAPARLSVYAQQNGDGWQLLRGGIATIDPRFEPTGTIRCKDVWVMSDEAVPMVSLLPSLDAPSAIRRTADIPSRVADDLFWLGRYSERIWLDAQYLEKWIALGNESQSGTVTDTREGDQAFLREAIVELGVAPEGFHEDADLARWRLFDSLNAFGSTAMRVMERFSVDAQRTIGKFGADFRRRQRYSPRNTLDEIAELSRAFSGIVMEGMTRTTGWRFLEIGRRLERSLLLCRSLETLFPEANRRSRFFFVILELFDSLMTYRFRYQQVPHANAVIDLLILDESNPRSLAFQLDALSSQIQSLPGIRDGAYRSRPERTIIELVGKLRAREGGGITADDGQAPPADASAPHDDSISLRNFIAEVDAGLVRLSESVTERYLTQTESAQFVKSRRKRG